MENNLEDWRKAFIKESKGLLPEENVWRTFEGIDVKQIYTKEDIDGISFANTLPGFAPFVRGVKSSMYTVKPWTIRQYAGFSTAEESNKFYKQLLSAGAQGISVAFDLPTHRGYDSDDERVIADVGKAGVPIDTVEDMKILFDGIPIDEVSVSMTMNGAVLPILACFIVVAEERNISISSLKGTIQNDILKEFIVRNTYIYPPEPSMRIVRDIMAYCAENIPLFNTISISGYHMQEAGANAAIELAYTLSNGKEYIKCAIEGGLDIDVFAPRFSFFFGVGMNFFTEIAKLRAARLLWQEIVKEFNPKNDRSLLARIHCQTSGWSLTNQDPLNNITRTTIEAMAAVFGGTQSLHTNSFNEAMSLPSENSARIARNTQWILQNETGLTKVVDPWGGSYMMESLTNDLMIKAKELMKEIDNAGGMVKAIQKGIPKHRIETSAALQQSLIDSNKQKILGVNNMFHNREHESEEILDIDHKNSYDVQIKRLKETRLRRNEEKLNTTLYKLKNAAKDDNSNLLQLTINAMRARATVGEVTKALEEHYGRYENNRINVSGVYGEGMNKNKNWEETIESVRCFAQKHGRNPRILIGKMGQDGHDRGANIIATGFSDAGFDVDLSAMFCVPKEIARQAIDNDVHVIGISSLAGAHKILIEELVNNLKEHNSSEILLVVGGIIPKKDYDTLINLGVAKIFETGTPVYKCVNSVINCLNNLD